MTKDRACQIKARATDRLLRLRANPNAATSLIERHTRYQRRAHWLWVCAQMSDFGAPGFWKITQAL